MISEKAPIHKMEDVNSGYFNRANYWPDYPAGKKIGNWEQG